MRNRWLSFSLLLAVSAHAHIPLTEEILDAALGEIAEARSRVDDAQGPEQTADALYELAVQGSSLQDLLNQEIRLHGLGQQGLMDSAAARAKQFGIEITWSQDHVRYFYTGEAYRRYLEIVPDGVNAANSLFHLIETGFYLGDPEDRDSLAARAADELDYLERFADLGNAGRVAIFLAIDYRDLWRLCRASRDADCAAEAAKRLRDHLDEVASRFAGKETASMAESLRRRFEAEAAETP